MEMAVITAAPGPPIRASFSTVSGGTTRWVGGAPLMPCGKRIRSRMRPASSVPSPLEAFEENPIPAK